MSKAKVVLSSVDGNIFCILGGAANALRRNGQHELIKEMNDRVTSSHSYEEALSIIMEYVDFVDNDDDPVEEDDWIEDYEEDD